MYKTVILSSAQKDVREAALWYNKQQQGLGKRFTSEVRRKVHLIANNPYAYSTKFNEVQAAIIDVFPYMIHFRIDVEYHEITIIAVLHTSINPKKWDNR